MPRKFNSLIAVIIGNRHSSIVDTYRQLLIIFVVVYLM